MREDDKDDAREGKGKEGKRKREKEARKMALNLLLEAYMRRGEMDKMHGIMKEIREVEGKQLRYLNMIWKRLLGITDESKLPPSTTRQMPCIIGGEMSIISSLSMRGGKMRGERGKHNEAEREAERGKAKCLSSRPKKAV